MKMYNEFMSDTNNTANNIKNIKSNEGNSNFVKVLIVGFLAFLLFIPTLFVGNLISERAQRYEAASKEIASKWGSTQTIHGALIVIPYKKTANTDIENKFLYVLPDNVTYNTQVTPVAKSRGMYETVVYDSAVAINGDFNLSKVDLKNPNLDLAKAMFVVGVSDMSGLYQETSLTLNNKNYPMSRGTNGVLLADRKKEVKQDDMFGSEFYDTDSRGQAGESGLYTPINLNSLTSSNSFSLNLALKGSQEIYFVPTAKNTTATVNSAWTRPSFDGYILPDTSDNDASADNGFQATWKVSEFNSPKPASFTQSSGDEAQLDALADQSFGVKFRQDVDFYQKSERSVKYAMLFILLTFVTFFCFEILGSKKRIHPIQYIFIGLALVIFYVLLIAFAEYLGFGLAYLAGALATVALITFYSYHILKSKKMAGAVFTMLAFIYAYLYILLQMEENTLLVGAISLFIALAAIMFVTRNVDWYGDSAK